MLTYTLSEFTNNRQHYASIIENPEQLLTAHTHDYFELTLVRSGACIHHINGDEIPLQTAVLSLIRPQDYHWYEPSTHNFQLINVIVPRTTINAMFAYLGNGFESSRLLDTPLPPTTQMSMSDFQSVQNELKQLILYKNVLGQKADALFHITILNIITRQFPMTLAPYAYRCAYLAAMAAVGNAKAGKFCRGSACHAPLGRQIARAHLPLLPQISKALANAGCKRNSA